MQKGSLETHTNSKQNEKEYAGPHRSDSNFLYFCVHLLGVRIAVVFSGAKNPGIIRMSGFLCYLKAAILHTAAMLAHGIAGRSNPMGSVRHTNYQKRNHPDGWFLVVSEHDRSIADPYGNTPPTASAPCRLGICFDRRSKPAALHTAAMLAHGIAGRSNPMGSVRHTNHQKRNHPDGWFLFW